MSDDLKRLREDELARQPPNQPPAVSAAPTILALSEAQLATKAGQFFAAHPLIIAGEELELGDAKIYRDTSQSILVYEPNYIPPAGSVITATHVPWRWVRDESADPVGLTLKFEYLAYTPSFNGVSGIIDGFACTTERKSIELPLYSDVRPLELGFLPSQYTYGSRLSDLPAVRLGNGIQGRYLYDYALGWNLDESAYDGKRLMFWSPLPPPASPPIVIPIHNKNAPNFLSMIFRTLGFHSFALANIDGRWRLAHSIRVSRQHFTEGPTGGDGGFFPPNPAFGIDGAGFVVYRWGEPMLDNDHTAVFDFSTVDSYDYFAYNNQGDWTRRVAPPNQDFLGVTWYLTGTDGTTFEPMLTPWAATALFPPFGTFRVRLYGA